MEILRATTSLRAVARAGFWGAERVKVWVLGTRYHERHWRKRHLFGGTDWDTGQDWVGSYWESREHAHRSYLIGRVLAYRPASVIEFGCNCGPNLCLLHRADPALELTGVDINPVAIKKGRELLAKTASRGANLVLGGIEALAGFPDHSFDVFFTDAVLMYIAPDRIRDVLAEAIRLSRRAVVMLEWHDGEAPIAPRGGDVFVRGHWVRNYRLCFEALVAPERVRVTRFPPGLWPGENWSRWGHVIEVDLCVDSMRRA